MLKRVVGLLLLIAVSIHAKESVEVAVLCYHRFGNEVKDSMTVTNSLFESHLKWLKDNGYTVVSADALIKYLDGEGSLPQKSVVITVDDGHISVYTDMQPLIKKYNVPVTLFIYPSAISNASYAMKWEQLRELQNSGLFDIQSHLLWHPNFKQEKKRLKPDEYEKFVKNQLGKSKAILEKRMEKKIDTLAWAFGIYDEHLEEEAKKTGYGVAFTIDRRHASKNERDSAQPRYLMTNSDNLKNFEAIITGSAQNKSGKKISY